MSALPTKRVLVYVAIGLVILIVGGVGIASAGGEGGEAAVIVDAGEAGSAGSGSVDVSAGSTWSPVGLGATSTTTEATRIWVQVAGAVNVPGVYQLLADSRVFEAVAAAGGFSAEADEQAIALAAQVFDGCRVYVPEVGETVSGGVVGPDGSSAGVTGVDPAGGSGGELVSLNSATAAELDTLPGIGPSLAEQIVIYRETKGPFTSIDELTDVPGIGPAKLEQLRPLVVL